MQPVRVESRPVAATPDDKVGTVTAPAQLQHARSASIFEQHRAASLQRAATSLALNPTVAYKDDPEDEVTCCDCDFFSRCVRSYYEEPAEGTKRPYVGLYIVFFVLYLGIGACVFNIYHFYVPPKSPQWEFIVLFAIFAVLLTIAIVAAGCLKRCIRDPNDRTRFKPFQYVLIEPILVLYGVWMPPSVRRKGNCVTWFFWIYFWVFTVLNALFLILAVLFCFLAFNASQCDKDIAKATMHIANVDYFFVSKALFFLISLIYHIGFVIWLWPPNDDGKHNTTVGLTEYLLGQHDRLTRMRIRPEVVAILFLSLPWVLCVLMTVSSWTMLVPGYFQRFDMWQTITPAFWEGVGVSFNIIPLGTVLFTEQNNILNALVLFVFGMCAYDGFCAYLYIRRGLNELAEYVVALKQRLLTNQRGRCVQARRQTSRFVEQYAPVSEVGDGSSDRKAAEGNPSTALSPTGGSTGNESSSWESALRNEAAVEMEVIPRKKGIVQHDSEVKDMQSKQAAINYTPLEVKVFRNTYRDNLQEYAEAPVVELPPERQKYGLCGDESIYSDMVLVKREALRIMSGARDTLQAHTHNFRWIIISALLWVLVSGAHLLIIRTFKRPASREQFSQVTINTCTPAYIHTELDGYSSLDATTSWVLSLVNSAFVFIFGLLVLLIEALLTSFAWKYREMLLRLQSFSVSGEVNVDTTPLVVWLDGQEMASSIFGVRINFGLIKALFTAIVAVTASSNVLLGGDDDQ